MVPRWGWIVWVVGVTIILAILLNVVGEMDRRYVQAKTLAGSSPDCVKWLDKAQEFAESSSPNGYANARAETSIAYSLLALAHGCNR